MNPVIEAVRALILAAAMAHGVDADLMDRLARCESGYNPNSVAGPYMGLYQLGPAKRQRFLAEGYDNVFDPAQQANFVAEELANGDVGSWAGCNH